MKKNIVFQRLVAYLIDFFIVAAIASCISYIPFLNPSKNLYEEKYQEVLNIFQKLENNEITNEEYETEYIRMFYDLNRFNTSYTIINMVVLIGYFGVFQWQSNGQTIGKRLMKIKIVSKDEDKKISLVSYFVRCLVLNNIVVTCLELLVLYLMSADNYYAIYSNLNLVGYILLYITAFMMFIRTDHRGLHDLIASTKVVFVQSGDVVEEAIYEEVESKEDNKKSTKSKK